MDAPRNQLDSMAAAVAVVAVQSAGSVSPLAFPTSTLALLLGAWLMVALIGVAIIRDSKPYKGSLRGLTVWLGLVMVIVSVGMVAWITWGIVCS